MQAVDGLSEAEVRQPSALPGWTRAHVLAHLINNADAHRGMADGAARGEVVPQYAGGPAQREADIMRNAEWPIATLQIELRRACQELRQVWAAMPEAAWTNHIGRPNGPIEAWWGVRFRLLECTAHLVDLAIGYTPERWLPGVADAELAYIAHAIEERSADSSHGRWLIQRTDGPGEWSAGNGPAAGTISGRGNDLLAWLLGRSDASKIHIEGDVQVGGVLPRAYPYG